MRTRVAKWGNSLAVRLPKVVTDRLCVAPGTPLDVTREGTRIVIETAIETANDPIPRLEDLAAEMRRLGGASYDPGGGDLRDQPGEWPEYRPVVGEVPGAA